MRKYYRFLIPGLVIVHYITGVPVPEPMRLELIRYLLNRAHPEDGGWGIHIEGISTVFGTALNYVTLRILGLGPDHPAMVKARATLHKLGEYEYHRSSKPVAKHFFALQVVLQLLPLGANFIYLP